MILRPFSGRGGVAAVNPPSIGYCAMGGIAAYSHSNCLLAGNASGFGELAELRGTPGMQEEVHETFT